MSSVRLKSYVWPVLGLLGLIACVALSEPPAQVRRLGHRAPLLPRVEALKVMGAPWINMVADYYWIQTINAVGSAQTVKQYRDVYDYADLLTDLDPKFRQPYVFAAVVIALPTARGGYANVNESVKLLEKGLRQFPDYVMLRIILAYSYATYMKAYEKAGKLLQETALLPGAPRHIGPLATRMLAQAGEFDAAMDFAVTIAHSADNPAIRKRFEKRVKELQSERVLAEVDKAVALFKQQQGRAPVSVKALVEAGLLSAVPEDPLGGSIVLDGQGRARSTARRRRLTDFALED